MLCYVNFDDFEIDIYVFLLDDFLNVLCDVVVYICICSF